MVQSRKRNRQRTLAFLIAEPVDLLTLIAITSVFSYPKLDGKPAYLTKLISVDTERVTAGPNSVVAINSIPYSEYAGPIDTFIALGGESLQAAPSSSLTRWIRRSAARARRIVSVGSGTFMLASAGVLDGRRVTTHWQNVDQLAKRYPQLLIEKDPIFVKDGNVHTSAGAIAGIDLALSLVEDDLGTTVATSIARDLVLYLRRSGCEAQYSKLLAQQSNVEGTRMRNLPSWARSNVAQKLDVGALAKAVAMSPRTFVRQFDLRFRTTPASWVQSLRVEAACTLIVAQEIPLKAIATLAGFRDEQALRRAFLRQLSMTPKQYREHHGRLTFDCPLRGGGTEESAVEGTSSLSDHAVWRMSEDTGETVAPQRRDANAHVAA